MRFDSCRGAHWPRSPDDASREGQAHRDDQRVIRPVLHGGHLHILNEARKQGDVLIVGPEQRRVGPVLQGADAPIVPERQRAEMLLALRMVDYVHIFDEPDPIAFLGELKPDVHVNGSEYGENCVESGVVRRSGGEIYIVDRLPELSTTGLLANLQSRA